MPFFCTRSWPIQSCLSPNQENFTNLPSISTRTNFVREYHDCVEICQKFSRFHNNTNLFYRRRSLSRTRFSNWKKWKSLLFCWCYQMFESAFRRNSWNHCNKEHIQTFDPRIPTVIPTVSEISGKSIFKIRNQNFCYIQVIVFDLSISGSCWDLACTLPWKKCEKYQKISADVFHKWSKTITWLQ